MEENVASRFADEPGLRDLIRWCETKEGDTEWEDVERYKDDNLEVPATTYCQQLYSLVVTRTSGTAAQMVNNVTDENGSQAWRKLAKEFEHVTPQGRRKLLQLLLKPRQANSYEEKKRTPIILV